MGVLTCIEEECVFTFHNKTSHNISHLICFIGSDALVLIYGGILLLHIVSAEEGQTALHSIPRQYPIQKVFVVTSEELPE